MAKVTLSDNAPDELVRFNGWNVDFELGGSAKASYETDDRDVIRFAEEHPWLDVEYTAVEAPALPSLNTLAEHPELDALSGVGPGAKVPFDPEEIRKVEESKLVDRGDRVALDLSLDQGEPVEVGKVGDDDGTAVTLAADEDHDAAKSSKAIKPSTNDKKGDA